MPPVPRKRGDTYEPVTGTAKNAGGAAADLRGATLKFQAVATIGTSSVYINSGNVAHGVCVNVEDDTLSVADRGKFRYEPTIAGVSQAGLFNCELEADFGSGLIKTFPSAKSANPQLQIDEDIVPPA